MVSNGAKIILEEAAARELARLFLRPDIHAVSVDVGGAGNVVAFWFRILLTEESFGLLDGIAETAFALMGVVAVTRTSNMVNMWKILVILSKTPR